MFVSAALITRLRRGLWSFYQAVMSEISERKVKAFSKSKLLVVFWKNKKVYVAQEVLGMWNL